MLWSRIRHELIVIMSAVFGHNSQMTVDIFYFTLFVYSINAPGLDRIITTNSGTSQLKRQNDVNKATVICKVTCYMFRAVPVKGKLGARSYSECYILANPRIHPRWKGVRWRPFQWSNRATMAGTLDRLDQGSTNQPSSYFQKLSVWMNLGPLASEP